MKINKMAMQYLIDTGFKLITLWLLNSLIYQGLFLKQY